LRTVGAAPDLVPPTYTTEALGEAFPQGSGEVLMPRADIATNELEDAIRSKGWTPVRVDAYRARAAESIPAEVRPALDGGTVDAVTFTSASTVDGFVRAAGVVRGPAVVCIGPVTADAARRAGFAVDAVAEPHTIEGLVDAVERALRDRRSDG
ncbi:MAG TPA: uroporphyrinogen-III synthase, partial [Actinomycetota bacterium]|nr:uroporphyrinogen-III synthase [Actinomycetota bacterium]